VEGVGVRCKFDEGGRVIVVSEKVFIIYTEALALLATSLVYLPREKITTTFDLSDTRTHETNVSIA
jgi:hypothetical protein